MANSSPGFTGVKMTKCNNNLKRVDSDGYTWIVMVSSHVKCSGRSMPDAGSLAHCMTLQYCRSCACIRADTHNI